MIDSFVKRILDFIKDGDESKIKRFTKRLEKFFDDQQMIYGREEEDLNDELNDLKEELEDAILRVDMNRIGSVESTKQYVEDYYKTLADKHNQIIELEDDLEAARASMKQLSDLKKKLFAK